MTEPVALSMSWRSAMLGMVIIMSAICIGHLLFKSVERRSVSWLAAFVAATGITAVPMVIGFVGAYNRWPGLTFLPTDLMLLFGPLFYFHARTLMTNAPLDRALWWLLPGGIYWVYQVACFTLLGDYRQKWAYNDAVHEPFLVPVVAVIGIGLAIVALVGVWRTYQRYVAWLETQRSDDVEFRPVWLVRFLMLGVPLILIWVVNTALIRAFGVSYFTQFWGDFASLSLVFLLSVSALSRLHHPFPKMDAEPVTPDREIADESDEVRPEKDWSEEGERLRSAVVENQWYLEASLSIQDLSRRLGTNQTYISRSLNQGLGVSFSVFVNQLRVTHAKGLIEAGGLSMIEIALASGFGSKASFNRAFSAHAGQTPSQFLAAQIR